MTDSVAALRFSHRWLAIMEFVVAQPYRPMTSWTLREKATGFSLPVVNARPESDEETRFAAIVRPEHADGGTRELELCDILGDSVSEPVAVPFPDPEPAAALFGVIDGVHPADDGLDIVGWATCWLDPETPVEVTLSIDDHPLAVQVADLRRADIAALGFSGGRHGFRFRLRGPVAGLGGSLELRVGGRHIERSPWALDGEEGGASLLTRQGADLIRADGQLPELLQLGTEAAMLSRTVLARLDAAPEAVTADEVAALTAALAALEAHLPAFTGARPAGPPDAAAALGAGRLEGFGAETFLLETVPGETGLPGLRAALEASEADLVLLCTPGAAIRPADAARLLETVALRDAVWSASARPVLPGTPSGARSGTAGAPQALTALPVQGVSAMARRRLLEVLGEDGIGGPADLAARFGARAEAAGALLLELPVGATVPFHMSPPAGPARAARGGGWTGGMAAIILPAGAAEAADIHACADTVLRQALLLAAAGLRSEIIAQGELPDDAAELFALAGLPVHGAAADAAPDALMAGFLRRPDAVVLAAGAGTDPDPAPWQATGVPMLTATAAGGLAHGEAAFAPPTTLGMSGGGRLADSGLVPATGWPSPDPVAVTLALRDPAAGEETAGGPPAIRHPRLLDGTTLAVARPFACSAALGLVERGIAVRTEDDELAGLLKSVGIDTGESLAVQQKGVRATCGPETLAEALRAHLAGTGVTLAD
jgi:hypothetical protein